MTFCLKLDFDLKRKVNSARQKHIRAIISLRRWMIPSGANTDAVFGTRSGF
jgi:hypothetical protein